MCLRTFRGPGVLCTWVLVHGVKLIDAMANIHEMFTAIRRENLRLLPGNCNLRRHETKFLGHMISAEGVATDPNKVAAEKDWSTPTNVSQLRSFLRLALYYWCFFYLQKSAQC